MINHITPLRLLAATFTIALSCITAFPQKPQRDAAKNKWGYADNAHEWIIKPKWDEATPFFAAPRSKVRRALVRNKDKWQLIDMEGKNVGDNYRIITPVADDDILLVKDSKRWGIIDFEGKKILKNQFDSIVPLEPGLIMARQRQLWGVITYNAVPVHKYAYATMTPMPDGNLLATTTEGRPCLLARDGDEPLPAGLYMNISPFPGHKNLYLVANFENLVGIARSGGDLAIDTRYTAIEPLDDDIFIAVTPSGRGLIDTRGKTIYPCTLDHIALLPPGNIIIKKSGMTGLLDIKGNTIVEPRDYIDLSFTPQGYILTRSQQGTGLLTAAGELMAEPRYNEIGKVSTLTIPGSGTTVRYAPTRIADRWGFVTDRNVVVEPLYPEAPLFAPDGFARVTLDGAPSIVSIHGRRAVDPPVTLIGTVRAFHMSDSTTVLTRGDNLEPLDIKGSVSIRKFDNFIYITPQGEMTRVIGPDGHNIDGGVYAYAGPFINSPYALVAVKERGEYRWGIIDSTGHRVVNPDHATADEALAVLPDQNALPTLYDDRADDIEAISRIPGYSSDIADEPAETDTPVTFTNLYVDNNTSRAGLDGITIHADLTINGFRGDRLQINAYFKTVDTDTILRDTDGKYKTSGGLVGVGERVTMDKESTHLPDFTLFIPHDQLHVGPSADNLGTWLEIFDSTGRQLGSSWLVEFSF